MNGIGIDNGTVISLDRLRETPRRTQSVFLPRLGGIVIVRALTTEEYRYINRKATDPKTKEVDNFRLNLLTLAYGLESPRLIHERSDEDQALKDADKFDPIQEQPLLVKAIVGQTDASAEETFPALGDDGPPVS